MPGSLPGEFYFSTAERYSALHTCNTWAPKSCRRRAPVARPESCSRARFGGSSNGFSPSPRRARRAPAETSLPRTRRSCRGTRHSGAGRLGSVLAYHHRGARVLRHDYGGFRGGEGLLLLIHPPNIDAAISMLHRTFIIVSCEIAAISVHRESLQLIWRLMPGSGRARKQLPQMSYIRQRRYCLRARPLPGINRQIQTASFRDEQKSQLFHRRR